MEKVVGLADAARIAGVSRPAILSWVRKHEIGEKVGSRYVIDREKLDAVVAARKLLKLREPA